MSRIAIAFLMLIFICGSAQAKTISLDLRMDPKTNPPERIELPDTGGKFYFRYEGCIHRYPRISNRNLVLIGTNRRMISWRIRKSGTTTVTFFGCNRKLRHKMHVAIKADERKLTHSELQLTVTGQVFRTEGSYGGGKINFRKDETYKHGLDDGKVRSGRWWIKESRLCMWPPLDGTECAPLRHVKGHIKPLEFNYNWHRLSR